MSDTLSDTFTPKPPDGKLPNGKDGISVTCPGCQKTYLVQYPSPDHKGDIKVHCACGQLYTYESPHGPAPVDLSKLESTEGLDAFGRKVVDEQGNPITYAADGTPTVQVSDTEQLASDDTHLAAG